MNEVTDEQIAEYVTKPYTRMLTPAEEGGYTVEVLEIPGAISEGDTPDEAMAMIDDALGGVIAVMLEDGESIPEPMGVDEYSGRFNLRLSTETHRLAALRAQLESVSLNQWVGQAIEARLAGKSLADEVVEKLLGVTMGARITRKVSFEETVGLQPLPAADPGLLIHPAADTKWTQGAVQERSTIDA